jgi:hypothetical protein
MKFKTFLILLACAGVIILGSYLGMKFLGLSREAYKGIAMAVSLVVLVFALLIKQKP